ncbi:hypothetical protein F1D05_06655 [Kribbella qitaiheensis]|uniref:DUF4352 domain-containing protein n=1 Tax=Kribbella qitaiheensis TaxID=1544730 RepID=A0A7G6WUH7_9ACTN|nr:FxLYD domain-containing protein [Kribbella qitaiheensis]QNE17642.1 hypothetical protein F1D05_06655 [Kribbella qitaiheensis]
MPPPGQYQQPGQFQPPYFQPPKKKHTVRNVFLVLLTLAVLGVGGCVAFLGKAADDISKGIDDTTARNAPRDVKAGQAFSIGKHETLAGWAVKNELGMFSITGKVKNVSDATSTAFLHFKFLTKDGEVLGNVDCNSSDLEPGQTAVMNCVPDGKFSTAYAKITAEATF